MAAQNRDSVLIPHSSFLIPLRAWLVAHRSVVLGGLLVLGALGLYERTMARTVRPGDPGEFQLAAVVLGVPHPPGYPLWVLIAHAFTKLVPYGDALWRISLTSVVYGAIAVGLTYLVAQRLGVRWWLAAAAAALFAISPDFWGEATEPRAYALNAAQVALTLWLLLRWRTDHFGFWILDFGLRQSTQSFDAQPQFTSGNPKSKIQNPKWLLAAIGLLIGSALANHGTTLTLLPGYALFLLGVEWQTARAAGWSVGRTLRARLPDYGLAVGAGLLGLTPYLLPLVRFLQGGGPYYWGDPQSWSDFLRLVSGQEFRSMVFGIPWSHFGDQAAWGFQVLLDQYGWPGVIVGLVGWAILARRQPLVFGLLAGGFLCSFVFAIMYAAATNYFYFIPGHLFWALALGVAGEAGLAALIRRRPPHFRFWILDFGLPKSAAPAPSNDPGPQFAGQNPKSKIQNLKWLPAAVLLALIAGGVAARYDTAGWQHANQWRDGAEALFAAAPNPSIVYVGWEASSVIKYYQIAEGRRTDLILKAGNPADWAGHIRDFLTDGWALYVTEPPDALFTQFTLTPTGFAYRVEFRK